MTEHKITDHSNISLAEQQRLADRVRSRLIAFNRSQHPREEIIPVVLTVGDEENLLGGLTGSISWGWLHLELFWLDEDIRRQGIGSRLLQKAEEIATKHSCQGIHTDTFSFQALGFYTKNGYQEFGRIDDQPPGETRYYLQKRLRK